MRVTCPHMGDTTWLLLEDLFTRLDVEFIVPPPTTANTLKLGLQYSPEFACLPLKITIGNLIEGLQAGADTTIMVGGSGPCRFGYYSDIQRRLIQALGYEYEAIILEPPNMGLKRFFDTMRRIAPAKNRMQIARAYQVSFRKGQVFDRIDKRALEVRAFEAEQGATTRVRKTALQHARAARTPEEIARLGAEALAMFDDIPHREVDEYLKVGIVGEFYLVLEPFTNFDVEEYLGNRGVYLERAVYCTDWIGPGTKNPVGGTPDEIVQRWAAPYLDHHVGGEGQKTLGHTALYKHEGFDGVVHLMPFTCMPETIAKSILPDVSRKIDMPYITFVVDEQTGKAGVHTRLEAFLDLLWSRRKAAVTA